MRPEAKIIADSISPDGVRLTTLELTMHRFVLAEFNTHRAFSRNSASSRAIPINKTLDKVVHDPAWPLLWNSEKPGMQGGEPLTNRSLIEAQYLFEDIRDFTVNTIRNYLGKCEANGDDKLHKAYLNRLLEPFLVHKVIVSATDWDNFFEQRISPLALPEFDAIAQLILDQLVASVPKKLIHGEWHLPYTDDLSSYPSAMLVKISAARCARVSYETHDGIRDPNLDIDMTNNKLLAADPMHYSPFEHQAQLLEGDYGYKKSNFSAPWVQARTFLEAHGELRGLN